MRIKNTLIASVVGISLLGLPACTNGTNNTNNNQTGTQTNTQVDTQAKEEIKIVGAGSSYPTMEALAKAYESKVPNVKITFLPSSQTAAAITAVEEGLSDMGAVTRAPKSEEDPQSELEYKPVAKDGLVVATHSGVTGVTNLQTEQIKKIYSGAIKNWKDLGGEDAPIILLDRPEDESAKKLLREHYLGKDLPNSPDAVIHRSEGDLRDSLQNTPYTIGAFSLGYSLTNKLPVNHLSLDGIAPTTENIETGKYIMIRDYGFVFKKTPSPSIQGFVDFINSPEGVNALKAVYVVPVAQKSP